MKKNIIIIPLFLIALVCLCVCIITWKELSNTALEQTIAEEEKKEPPFLSQKIYYHKLSEKNFKYFFDSCVSNDFSINPMGCSQEWFGLQYYHKYDDTYYFSVYDIGKTGCLLLVVYRKEEVSSDAQDTFRGSGMYILPTILPDEDKFTVGTKLKEVQDADPSTKLQLSCAVTTTQTLHWLKNGDIVYLGWNSKGTNPKNKINSIRKAEEIKQEDYCGQIREVNESIYGIVQTITQS